MSKYATDEITLARDVVLALRKGMLCLLLRYLQLRSTFDWSLSNLVAAAVCLQGLDDLAQLPVRAASGGRGCGATRVGASMSWTAQRHGAGVWFGDSKERRRWVGSVTL
jgi:hypothetical protein